MRNYVRKIWFHRIKKDTKCKKKITKNKESEKDNEKISQDLCCKNYSQNIKMVFEIFF